jgi:hypothetical protein
MSNGEDSSARASFASLREELMRELRDERGETWLVYEVQRSMTSSELAVPEELRRGWLCFESGTHKRRIAPIPPGWREISAAALLRLGTTVPAVPKRTR